MRDSPYAFSGKIGKWVIDGDAYQYEINPNFRVGFIYIDIKAKRWCGFPRDGIGMGWAVGIFEAFRLDITDYIFDENILKNET